MNNNNRSEDGSGVHILRQELASLVYGLRQLCGWRKCDLGGKMRSESRVVGEKGHPRGPWRLSK